MTVSGGLRREAKQRTEATEGRVCIERCADEQLGSFRGWKADPQFQLTAKRDDFGPALLETLGKRVTVFENYQLVAATAFADDFPGHQSKQLVVPGHQRLITR